MLSFRLPCVALAAFAAAFASCKRDPEPETEPTPATGGPAQADSGEAADPASIRSVGGVGAPAIDGGLPASLPEWKAEFASRSDPAARRDFIAETLSVGPRYREGALRAALEDPSEEVRAEAMSGVPRLPTDRRHALLVELAIGNDSETVRAYAMDDISTLPRQTRAAMYRELLESAAEEVREVAISRLADFSTKESFEMLLDGWGEATYDDVRATAPELVEQLVGVRFDGAGEAKAWWAENEAKFDDYMSAD